MNELLKTDERYSLIADQFTDEVLEMYANFEYLKQQKELFEYKLAKVCEENGIKSVDNEYWRINYIQPGISKRVDVQKLKEDGLYENYTKESEVKGHIRVTVK